MMNLHPIVYLTAVTGLVVGFFVWRGSGKLWKAIVAAPLTWAFLMVLPVLAMMFLAYLAGFPREQWGTAWGAEWGIGMMAAFNVAVWAWLLWQRFAR